MSSTYDAELSLAVSRQRGVELRAEAARHRLARQLHGGRARPSWWLRAWPRRHGTAEGHRMEPGTG